MGVFLDGQAIPGNKTFVNVIPPTDTVAQYLTDSDVNFVWNALTELRDVAGGYALIATVVSDWGISIPAAGTWTQLDDGLSGRPAKVSNRGRIRLVNKSEVDRVYVLRGTSTVGVTATQCEAVEPSNGILIDEIGVAVNIYVQSAGGTAIVRLVQYGR